MSFMRQFFKDYWISHGYLKQMQIFNFMHYFVPLRESSTHASDRGAHGRYAICSMLNAFRKNIC